MPRLLDLLAAAKRLLFEYLQSNADKVNELNSVGNERLAGMYSKFDYHIIRLSFLIVAGGQEGHQGHAAMFLSCFF